MSLKTVLLAEDSEDDVAIFQIAFSRATLPCRLEVVSDGQEAVERLQNVGAYSDARKFPRPDVLVLDIKMPRKNGFEVLEFAKANPPTANIPVVILSSSDEPKDVKHAYELGATTYFIKSPRYEDVLLFLRTLTLPR